MTEMWFMRHGETDWNVVRRLQGWRDIPLNETGRAQAQSLGEHLKKLSSVTPFDVAYTSDLVRTVNTLAPAAELLAMTPILEPGLRERHYGLLEGLAVGELADKAPPAAYAAWANREENGSVGDNGETLRQFHDRIIGTVSDIASRHVGQRVLVMTHGGVLDIIWRHAQSVPLVDKRRTPMYNVSINRVKVGASGWEVLGWGDVSHMPSPVGNDVVA